MNENIHKTDGDYVFRFQLTPPSGQTVSGDPLTEMVRTFMADFLNMGFLTKNGERVVVDGFAFMKDPQQIYEVFPRVEKE